MAKIIFEKARCTGCGSCCMACMNEHSTDISLTGPFCKVSRKEILSEGKLFLEFTASLCAHCPDAPCASVCPVGCINTDDKLGIVMLDNSSCIGCGLCEDSCRYTAIRRYPDGRAEKCDGCIERQREGKLPACVKACPFGALHI